MQVGADFVRNLRARYVCLGDAFRRTPQGLTSGAPECGARILPLLARFDRCTAFSARLVAPAVDPQTLFGVGPFRGTPHSRISYYLVAGSLGNVGEQKLSGRLNQAADFVLAQAFYASEWIDSARET